MGRRLAGNTARRRPSVRTEEEAELELFERGWKPARLKGFWVHKRLELTWPTDAALHLQDETDAGMQDEVHRMLRGDRS